MGVRGLFTYLTQKPGNFTNQELHNTYLVIDGRNYSAVCYRDAAFAYHYGGEYLNFAVRVRAALHQFRKCRIKPIFVFDGCHEGKGAKREKLLRKNAEFIKALSQFLNYQPYGDPDNTPESASEFLPRMIHQVFISVLKEFGMHHVTCEREADIHVAELACYLNCPVVSNDSDFFLFGAPSSSDYRVVPLTMLEQRCKPLSSRCGDCSSNSVCYGLPCKVFRQSKSVFREIHPPLLPLLSVLLGNDFMSAVPWPTRITYLNSLHGAGLSYNGRRIQAVVTWLSIFSQDVSSPVREILSLIPHYQLNEMTTQIIACIRGYVLDLHTVCEQLAHFLSLKGDVKLMHGKVASSSKPQMTKDGSKISSLDDAVTAVVNALLSKNVNTDSVNNTYSILEGWPNSLVTKFRQGGIITSTLDSLYVTGGAVFRVLIESLRISNSVYSVTEPIRRLEYGLLLGLEHKLGNVEKLCGSDGGQPVETRRQGYEMCRFEFDICPLALSSIKPTTKEFIGNFLKQHLQLDLNMFHRESKESLTIACVLILWFKHSQLASSTSNLLCDSSVALAFSTCSLIMSAFMNSISSRENELESMGSKLSDCIMVIADNLKEHCFKVGRRQFSIEIIHQLNELQLVYQEFHQLIDLLDVLSTDSRTNEQLNEQLLSFSQPWIMFPSGRLLHWLCNSIEASAPEDRLHQVKEVWIPRLLSGMPENEKLHCETLADCVTDLLSSADDIVKA